MVTEKSLQQHLERYAPKQKLWLEVHLPEIVDDLLSIIGDVVGLSYWLQNGHKGLCEALKEINYISLEEEELVLDFFAHTLNQLVDGSYAKKNNYWFQDNETRLDYLEDLRGLISQNLTKEISKF